MGKYIRAICTRRETGMNKKWTLHVENFAKIKSADVTIAPLMCFVGDNNSGKSYLMSILWGILTLGKDIFPKKPSEARVYKQCEDWLKAHINTEIELSENDMELYINWFNELLNTQKKSLVRKIFNYDVEVEKLKITNYESMGEDAFLMKSYKHYSAELKRKAVLDYLSGKGSQTDICKKYGIRSKSKLQKWIKKYNGHEELKSSGTGGSIIMTKGRKTTFEERVEIVQYCIAHNHNYAETAENHRVSYQQARSYTIKYESGGVEALRDKRGKRKNPDEMNELESLRAEVKILRAEKERAEMEASFLKKLEEIERRRG